MLFTRMHDPYAAMLVLGFAGFFNDFDFPAGVHISDADLATPITRPIRFGSVSPESGNVWDDREKIVQTSWSSPASSKLLLEAGLSSFNSRWGGQIPAGSQTGLIPVTESSTAAGVPIGAFSYRGWASAASNDQQHNVWRASATYVTGSHSAKVAPLPQNSVHAILGGNEARSDEEGEDCEFLHG
jgi:hypothetical protein